MVGWQRHLQSVIGQIARRRELNCSQPAYYLCSRLESSLLSGEANNCIRVWKSPAVSIPRSLCQYMQQMGISSSRKLQAGPSEETPIPSPLSPVLQLGSGKTDDKKSVSKPSTVQAVLKGIKQSPKKVNLVAALVRGMRVEDALLQLQVTVKRAAKTVYQVIHSARANATHNHGLDPDRLLVAEAFVGKGNFLKRMWPHGRGKAGVRVRSKCRLTVVVREITAEEEAEIAKLKVHNFKKLTKREKRLVPHQLIETTPIWDRKAKRASQEPNGMAAAA